MPADDPKSAGPKSAEPKKSVDLTDPAQSEELTDEELKKVTGGFQRATLTTNTLSSAKLPGANAATIYGGVGNDTLLGLTTNTVYGDGFNVNPTDKLKR